MDKRFPFLLAALLAWSACAAWAQSPAEVRETLDESLEIDRQAQAAADSWARERAGMRAEYETLKHEARRLELLQENEIARTDALGRRTRELERRLLEAVRLEDSLQDTLLTIAGQLADAVANDLPFLPEERGRRLTLLEAELARPDVSPGEKLRRLLEALQVEAAYGGTVEVYQGDIELDGRTMLVDILRLGRLSLFWMSLDGKQAGEFDRAAGRWRALPGRHRRTIRQAMEMASRTRSMELLDLPLGRLAP